MTKELLTIEFRYHDRPKNDAFGPHETKTITIGVYDTLEEAIAKGNECLKILSERFEVRAEDKFMLKHLFGSPKRLVTNCCYSTKGIQYFAQIKSLKFDDLTDTIDETFKALDRYREYKLAQDLED